MQFMRYQAGSSSRGSGSIWSLSHSLPFSDVVDVDVDIAVGVLLVLDDDDDGNNIILGLGW